MAWTWNATVNAWVDDAGLYLPSGAVKPRCPHHSLFAGDVNEIDYVVVPTGTSPSTFDGSQARYDSYSFIYDEGTGSNDAFSASQNYEDLTVSAVSYRLFLVVYTDGGSGSAPPFTALDVAPSSYVTGGGAAAPTPPANDDFANATNLPSAVSSSFTAPADLEWSGIETAEAGGQYPWNGNTVWYKFVPPVSGDYTFTCQDVGSPTGSSPAGWIYAYRASAMTGSHPAEDTETWGQNNVGGSRDVMLIDGAIAGETIWLQLDLAEHYAPHYTWVGPAPANDDYANRLDLGIVSASIDVPFDLRGSTVESGEQHTTGMTGSVWYQVQIDTLRLVLFEVPAGVEVRIYRGTASLAGMLYRDVSNDTTRQAFTMDPAYTYWVKLQSATATEVGTMHVRPFAWTGYQPRPTVLEYLGGQYSTIMARGLIYDEGDPAYWPTKTAAWSSVLAGYSDSRNRQQYSGGALGGFGTGHSNFGTSMSYYPGGGWVASYNEAVYAIDFADWLDPGAWPTDPGDFQPTLIQDVDWGADPASGDAIQYEPSVAAEVGTGMGKLAATGSPASNRSNTTGGHSVDVYVQRYTPTLDPTSDLPAWVSPSTTSLRAFTLDDYTGTGTVGSVTNELDTDYDVVADLGGGTKISFLLMPDPALPADPGAVDPTSLSTYALLASAAEVQAAAPILFPRFKTYAPLPAATAVTGWQVGSVAW